MYYVPPFDDNGKDGDVRWIDTGNSRCLCESLGTELLEFLTAFKTHGRTCIIIQPSRNADCFIPFCTRSCNLFLADVSSIMVPDPELFNDGKNFGRRNEGKAVKMIVDEFADHFKGVTCVQVADKRLSINLDVVW